MIENVRGKRNPQNARHKLVDVLPLKAPYIMNIITTDKCNFKCRYCPSNNKEINPKYRKYVDSNKINMDMNMFYKLADDLETLEEKVKVVYLCGVGEALLHPQVDEIIRTLKTRNLCREVRNITNGSVLSSEMNKRLIDAGLDNLMISIQALDRKGYKEICGVNFDFDRLVDNVRDYYERCKGTNCTITAKIFSDSLRDEEEYNRFYDIFEPITHYQEIRYIESKWPEFEVPGLGNQQIVKGVSEIGTGCDVCSGMFTESYIRPNGDVCLCRLDWGGRASHW